MLAAIRTIAVVAVATVAGWHAAPARAALDIAQAPLFQQLPVPPLNMLVMDRDHKLFYEAYNDSSDLNGDGVIDIGYKPDQIDYYGYFDSYTCYDYSAGLGRFVPAVRNGPGPAATPDRTRKRCSGRWSGDFLNYLTTTRMDALRKVLYGGRRVVDTAATAATPSVTVLERAYVPQDGHSFGKEYTGIAEDGYDIRQYTPIASLPGPGRKHLFANLALSRGGDPLLRVIQNSSFRIWNWISIERPVGGNDCFNASNNRVNCLLSEGDNFPLPPLPANRTQMDTFQAAYATPDRLYGVTALGNINCTAGCNPSSPDQNEFLAVTTGFLRVTVAGSYRFQINGDMRQDFALLDGFGNVIANTAADRYGGGEGTFGTAQSAAAVSLAVGTYRILHRYVDGSSNPDQLRVDWQRTVGAPTFGYTLVPVSTSVTTPGFFGLTISTYDLTLPRPGGANRRDDYIVRVEVCKDSTLREDNCREYGPAAGPTSLKPTGLLHDYGETNQMFFGLISGSWDNNHQGGVLRRRMAPLLGRDLNNDGDFLDPGETPPEVNINTGQFVTGTQGIIHNLDRFAIGGFRYPPDAAYHYGNVGCPALGSRAADNGECPDWGNPIAEMMWESLRYFAGAGAPVGAFSTAAPSAGTTIESDLGLSEETVASGGWLNPYRPLASGGFPFCAKPFQTVISDINPSFDSNLPGNAFGAAVPAATNPAAISGLNVATEAQTIWNQEGLGTRTVFAGEVGASADGAPTAKTASSFGDIRGMPEEPTKQGTYYAASVARFGFLNDISAARSAQNLRTYAVALASPRPKMEFPVAGGGRVSLVPFAKTITGCFGATPGAAFQASNTLVDFYVEQYVNIPGGRTDPTINGGRPFAVFRINWEDVEQGNDHDMDAIVRYQLQENADGTIGVNLTSEYAAGSCVQYMGYVISGTTQDGIYLDVRDRDTGDAAAVGYRFATPAGLPAGACNVPAPPAACTTTPVLTLNNSRTFTASPAATAAETLRDPLWYAAKYGGFREDAANANQIPDLPEEWDVNGDGMPDNYFLVTNALGLRAQLQAAFDRIVNENSVAGGVTVSGVRLDSGSVSYVPEFRTIEWTGDLKAFEILPNGDAGAIRWSANARLPLPPSRRIYTSMAPGYGNSPGQVTTAEFTVEGLGGAAAVPAAVGLLSTELATRYGGATPGQVVDYLRGDQTREVVQGGPFRNRQSKIGDIIGSQPALMRGGDDYGYSRLAALPAAVRNAYETFLGSKSSRPPVVMVGSNGGMFHAFNARGNPAEGGGTEFFAFVPSSARRQMGQLLNPAYQHRYFVDGSPQVGDVWDGTNWRSIVAASVGVGGRSVFALDVTDPVAFDGSKVLWELTEAQDADLGFGIARPAIVPLEDGRFYVVFGNGYNSGSQDAVLFAADATTGRVANTRKLVLADGNDLVPNGLGPVTVIDTNGNGLGDTIYAGDFQGNLWKVSVNASGTLSSAFGATPLFVATDGATPPLRQNITGGITVTRGAVAGTYVVLFGTGRYFLVGDNAVVPNPQQQTLYGIIDRGVAVTGGRSALVRQSITSVVDADADGDVESREVSNVAVNVNTASGWFLDLRNPAPAPNGQGERFFGRPRVVGGNVLFSTFTPRGNECTPGGLNQLLCLRTLTGGGGNCLGATDGLTLLLGPPVPEPPVVQPPQCDTLDCTPPRPQPPEGSDDPNFCSDPANATGQYCLCRADPGSSAACPCLLDPDDPSCAVPDINAGVLPGLCPVYVLTPAGPALTLLRPCGRQAWREIR